MKNKQNLAIHLVCRYNESSGDKMVSSTERNELYERIRSVQVFINNNKISYSAIEENMCLERREVNQFSNIVYSSEIPEDEKKFTKLKRLVDIMEDMVKIASQDFEDCRTVINRGYHELGRMDFLKLFERVKKDFPKESQDLIIEQAKEKLSLEFDKMQSVFSNGFSGFVDEYYSKSDAYKILKGHDHLETCRMIESEEAQCELYEEYLTYGIRLFYFDDEDNEYEDIIELSGEEAEKYRRQIEAMKINISVSKEYLSMINASQEDIEAAKTAERYYNLFHSRYNTEYFAYQKESNISGFVRQKFQKNNKNIAPLTGEQQKALLAVYLDKCFDENGFLLPEHFGAGIHLINLYAGYHSMPFGWITQNDKYDIGYKLPKIDVSSPLYKLIDRHRNVFIKAPCRRRIKAVRRKLQYVSDEAANMVFLKLKNKFHWENIYSDSSDEYYQTWSEYAYLISIREPITKSGSYSREDIYQAVYEVYSSSGMECVFSEDIILHIENVMSYDRLDWLWEMNIFLYCSRYKDVIRLISYIEKCELKAREICFFHRR